MEETKLDKAIDKLFRFVEKVSNKFINAARSQNPYFGIVFAFIYIPYVILFFADVYYDGWRFINLSNGTINISFISNLLMAFLLYPYYIYFFNRSLFKNIDLKLLKISSRIFVEKVVAECFKPIIADWREEYLSAINQNRKWQTFSVNFRYTYAFLAAMIQQSSLHRLLEIFQIFTKK
jgi:hypothetical protein